MLLDIVECQTVLGIAIKKYIFSCLISMVFFTFHFFTIIILFIYFYVEFPYVLRNRNCSGLHCCGRMLRWCVEPLLFWLCCTARGQDASVAPCKELLLLLFDQGQKGQGTPCAAKKRYAEAVMYMPLHNVPRLTRTTGKSGG